MNNKIIKQNNNLGFTLVEMMIYVALMTIITLVVVQSLIVVLKSNRTSFAEINLRNAGYSAMESMLREIYASDSITTASGILQMNQGTNIVKFATSTLSSASTTLYFYEGVGTPVPTIGPLTSKSVLVKSLTFTKISTGKSYAVKIQMGLETTVNGITKSETFQSTAILRGSY
ncbi:MAG: prepilin-type N-terminal cleavage/methylation domain-containing protein [Candidatus Paceibacterota bacterium]|jgi:Tfp pilus assembly protein PilE